MSGSCPEDPTPTNLLRRSNQNGAPKDKAIVVKSNLAIFEHHAMTLPGEERQPSGRLRLPRRSSITSRSPLRAWPVSFCAAATTESRSAASFQSELATSKLSHLRYPGPEFRESVVLWRGIGGRKRV